MLWHEKEIEKENFCDFTKSECFKASSKLLVSALIKSKRRLDGGPEKVSLHKEEN